MTKKQQEKTMTRRKSGFTLIEILLVVVIIGILAGIGIPALSGKSGKAKVAHQFYLFCKDRVIGDDSPALKGIEDFGRVKTQNFRHPKATDVDLADDVGGLITIATELAGAVGFHHGKALDACELVVGAKGSATTDPGAQLRRTDRQLGV